MGALRAKPGLGWVRALGLTAGALVAGCAHYQMGAEGHLAFRSVYIAPVATRILLPQAQALLSTQLRTNFEHDPRVVLVGSPEAADATLEVTIIAYKREIAAVREQDTGLASKFSITLTALCTLRDTHSSRVFFRDREVKVARAVYTDNGQPSYSLVGVQQQAEYNTLPVMANALADKVAHTVLDVW